MLAEDRLDRRRLVAVVERRRGAVRVDVVHVFGREVGLLQRATQRPRQPRAAGRRLGDVVRVRRRGVADDLGVDVRATRARHLQILQHQHARALAQHEAVALGVEGAARAGRIVVMARERAHVVEGGHRHAA